METSKNRRYLYIGAAAGAAAYLWMKSSSSARKQPTTDFDSFLRAPAPTSAPTSTCVTSFESFLRVQPEEPNSTDFASFLRDRSAGATTAGNQQASDVVLEDIPEDAVPVLVMYGTEYGFAREIAEKLAHQLKETGKYWPSLTNAADHPSGFDLSSQQAAFMIFSTQGDGVPPMEARDFCEWLFAGKAGQLSGLPYSVCGLGDTTYTHFCRCGKQVDAAMAGAGAAAVLPRIDVDKEDWVKVDGWIAGVLSGLDSLMQAGSLKSFVDLGGVPAAAGPGNAAAAPAASKKYSKSRPYYARVVAVEGLCVLSGPEDKDTLRLELAIESEALEAGGLSYMPGDALGIWPSNPPQAVDELLGQLGASGDEQVPLPSWHYQENPEPEQRPTAAAVAAKGSSTISLRHALTVCYDIKTPKAQVLLQTVLAQLQQQQQQQQHGKGGSSRLSIDVVADASATAAAVDAVVHQPNGAKGSVEKAGSVSAVVQQVVSLLADAAGLEAYLAARHVVDLLQDVAPAAITYQQLLPALRPLAPRLYSISSSPLEHSPHNSGVQATIAVVRYTSLGKPRQGVCSTHVAERLTVGQTLPIFISKNPDFRLPQDPATPIIMIGPGTGLAPFRSFILQRLLEQQQQQGSSAAAVSSSSSDNSSFSKAAGPMHLFFGCRRRDQDFLYGQQLQQWHNAGAITLHTAFSREGPSKVYVQQRLREAAADVWTLLQAGGHFYICGDAGSMAGAVEQALLGIIEQHQAGGTAASAKDYLEQLAAAGRYQRDVWFS